MKNWKLRRDQFMDMLFSLTDEGVEFRNRWRAIISMVLWLFPSLLSIAIMLPASGSKNAVHLSILALMSFIKYIPLLMVVYSLARVMAARYLNDIYELEDENHASEFLEQVAFGYGREFIVIDDGRISPEDEESPLITIGGPGAIQVNLDSVALLESIAGQPTVIYPQNTPWKLGRFERLREIGKLDQPGEREYAIINLRDQFVSGLSIKSRTKDGIPLEAHDIKIIFSILRRQSQPDAVQGDAYLFDERAVQALVYDQISISPQPSTPSGITFPWDTTIIPLVTCELEDLITSHNLGEILASISQKEVDTATNNDRTIMQMRLEMTGQQIPAGMLRDAVPPKFQTRSMITAQFFQKEFKEKAAKLGVSLEWIDIGTWKLPHELIQEKHREAWDALRENARKREQVELSRIRHETMEIAELVDQVIIKPFEKSAPSRKPADRELDKPLGIKTLNEPEPRRQFSLGEGNKQAADIALEILRAFRKEINAGRDLILNEHKPLEEKQDDMNAIDKALKNISILIDQWRP